MSKLLEITGKAISGEWGQDDDTGTGIPVLRTTNFTNEGFVNYKNVVTRSISKKNIAEKYLRHGDVIIEKSGGSDKQPVGRVIFFEGEENKYLFNNFTGLLRVQNPEEWLPKYVFYALYTYYRNGGTRAFENRTTGLHNLQVDNYVKSVDIPKLSYRKQQHICETLDHVRDAVAYRERQLTKLDELIKARFVEMFGDPYTNSKDYPLKKGESFFKLSNGKAVPESKRLNGGIPAYGGNGISWYTDESLFDADTIVVGRVGFQSGNVHLVKGPLWVTDNAMYMSSCDFSQYNLTFLIELMAHVDFTKFQDAGDLKKITQKPFMQFEYLCPPLSLQNQFSAFVAEVDKSKLLVGSAAAHKPFDIGFFSQKHCATPCKRGIISSKHVIFH